MRCSARQAGQDYSSLQSSLRNGDFQKADDITRQKLIELAGPGAVKRGWVYFTEVSIPFPRLSFIAVVVPDHKI